MMEFHYHIIKFSVHIHAQFSKHICLHVEFHWKIKKGESVVFSMTPPSSSNSGSSSTRKCIHNRTRTHYQTPQQRQLWGKL